ncbi:MAG: Abi family protein [Clostridiaceae bacterium]|jgi:abortive infection bacteriophage resistance protein|nr:Abi family protein [Clostridia bacterium]MBP6162099.1 Abi family protein [Clostridia bacterium]MBP6950542.1 Abi family protein [Clostridia bacterium]NMA35456.1 Abi family protein [Clostridiaceae bacterium]
MMLRKKTFRTYDEQIDFIKSRGIVVEDKNDAVEALSTYSYYSLVNLNKHLYGGLKERRFIGNPSLLDLQLAHMLNMNFYQVVLKGILYIEASFKTKLAYLVSRKYGVMSRDNINDPNNNFLYRGYYIDSHPVSTNILRSLAGKLRYLQSEKDRHSYSHHFLLANRQLPPWIFIHDVEFGIAIQWYNILRDQDKNEVCENMIWGQTDRRPQNVSIEKAKTFLDGALQVLREYRNTIAHGQRVFSSEMENSLPEQELFMLLPEDVLTRREYESGIGTNDPYACLLSIAMLIHDPLLMMSFLSELQSQLNFAHTMQTAVSSEMKDPYEILGIPPFTMERLIELSHQRFGDISRYYFDLSQSDR